jgi:hypothetical protein
LKHGRHPVYDRVLGISPSLVPTQATVAPVGPGPLPPLRSPDFYTAEVNVGPLVGVSVDVSIDRYGRLYFAPGVELGKSPTLVAGSLTAGYLNQASTPSAAQLHNFLTGHSGNVGGGFLLGAGETYTPGVGTATQVGVFSPQFGLAYHYGFEWR